LVDLAAPTPIAGTVEARARLVSFSRRKRRAYAADVARTLDELTGVVGSPASLTSAVLEASLAVAGRAEVIVLVGLDELSAADRPTAKALAEELAHRGIAVLLVGGETEPTHPDAGQVLVESGAGAGHE
jgi:hypothetical protein